MFCIGLGPAFRPNVLSSPRPGTSSARFALALRPGVLSQPRSSASSQRFVPALFPRFVPSVCLGLVAASPEGLWPCIGGGARGRGRAWTRHGEAENVRPLKQSFLSGRAKAKATNQDLQRGQSQELYRLQGIKEVSNARNDYTRRTQTRGGFRRSLFQYILESFLVDIPSSGNSWCRQTKFTSKSIFLRRKKIHL